MAVAAPSKSSFHRRALPPPSVEFSSAEGKLLFNEAMAAGTMGCFFRLIEQFHTQVEPAFCGLGTLTMVLNALNVDPQRNWKGPWRWFHEEMLDGCEKLDRIKEKGIVWNSFLCLARCNNAACEAHRIDEGGDLNLFRQSVEAVSRQVVGCTSEENDQALQVLVVSYSRKQFKQSGDGHYSPIGGYHAATDRVLILDVARFKHPPHWVPLTELHAAMARQDPDTGRSRGFAILSKQHSTWLSLVGSDSSVLACCGVSTTKSENHDDPSVAFSHVASTFKEVVLAALRGLGATGSGLLAAAAVVRQVVEFCASKMPLRVVCQQAFRRDPSPPGGCRKRSREKVEDEERTQQEIEACNNLLKALSQAIGAFDQALGQGPGDESLFGDPRNETKRDQAPCKLQGVERNLAQVLVFSTSLWEQALCGPQVPPLGQEAWKVLQPLLLLEQLPANLRLEVGVLRSKCSDVLFHVVDEDECSSRCSCPVGPRARNGSPSFLLQALRRGSPQAALDHSNEVVSG